jgi:hypothetical protein
MKRKTRFSYLHCLLPEAVFSLIPFGAKPVHETAMVADPGISFMGGAGTGRG